MRIRDFRIRLAALAAILLCPGLAPAAEDAQAALDACRALEDTERRLACYDAIPGRSVTGGPFVLEAEPVTGEPEVPVHRSAMVRRWELDEAAHGGLLRMRSHLPVYALPARYSSNPNERPSSPAPGRTVEQPLDLDGVEVKFQLSLKTKLIDNLVADNGDLWFGFTQLSNWQAFNTGESSPFRETNYMPELFTTWRTGIDLFGWRWQMVNFGFIHQSNGRSEPRSRSWDRLYAQFGFERGDWQLYLRPWLRIREGSDDDNPDIEDFLGHGDLRLIFTRGRHDFALLTRYTPTNNRGAVQFDWHYPLIGDLKAYLQFFHGYGETLIDYNHRQTTFGLGLSLVQW